MPRSAAIVWMPLAGYSRPRRHVGLRGMSMADSASRAPAPRATLKDVARAAGVSQSTTSRAMSGEGYVASAVRQRVLAAADELGYVPHAMARSLRKQVNRS